MRITRPTLAAVVALLGVGASTGTAHAHRGSVTYSNVDVDHEREVVSYRLRGTPADFAEGLGLEADQSPTDAQLRDRAPQLFAYVLPRIAVRSGDVACPATAGRIDVVTQADRFLELTWEARCPKPIEELVIDYDLFFDIDSLHTALLTVTAAGESTSELLDADASRFRWRLGDPPPSGALGFLRSGVDHILYGYDHIAFLLGLLLVAVIARGGGGYRARGVGPGLRYAASIVTSFTVAHSITLIAAALGWISLPSRLVESMIAASIVFVAVENIVRPDPPRRWLLTFAFGLFHGLGFASMLRPLLPPGETVVPLLLFNVGVELGQLAIAALAFPLLHAIARGIGADRYRLHVTTAASGVIGVAGLTWLLQRAL